MLILYYSKFKKIKVLRDENCTYFYSKCVFVVFTNKVSNFILL